MTRVSNKSPDAVMARLVADGFFKQADTFFSLMPKELNEGAAFAYQRRGELVAAITSLAFAVELYLKAIAIESGRKSNKTHDLLNLYGHLPEDVRLSIESRYATAVKRASADSLDAIELSITTTPFPPTAEEYAAAGGRRPAGDGVIALLCAEKDAFRSWRYIYETELPGGIAIFRVDFHKMSLLANALRQQIGAGANA